MSAVAQLGEAGSRPAFAVPTTPVPVQLLFWLFAIEFVIYIPVALLRTSALLLLQDALLVLALVTTLAYREPKRLFGGSVGVLVCAALFVTCIVPGVAIDHPESGYSTLQGIRSLVFGIAVLIATSLWMSTVQRVDRYVTIFVIGALFAAVYALRQVVFGLLPFELDRLALMGSSLGEIDKLGRVRIPSSFGDPATFAFVTMVGVMLFLLARQLGSLPTLTRRLAWPSLALLAVGLGVTLTRTPLMALVAGVGVVVLSSGRLNFKWVLRIGALAVAGVAAIYGINYLVVNETLAQSNVEWVKSVNNVLSSAWTLIPAFVSGDVGRELDTLRGLSTQSRLDGWTEGLTYLLLHPLGGGLGAMTEGGGNDISFSPIDVGVLRYGLELGWLGMFAMIGLWLAVLVAGLRKYLRISQPRTRTIGRYLMATWVAVGVAECITSFFHTELIAIVVWTLGGIILNLDKIANSEAASCVTRRRGADA